MIYTDWTAEGFALPPLAPATGPFSGRLFLETWWRCAAPEDARLLVACNDEGLLATAFNDGVLGFVGHEDLTDYHNPRGAVGPDLVAELRLAVGAGVRFRFDSLPTEAAEPMLHALRTIDEDVTMEQHTVAAVLSLPPTFGDYLEMIGKKERHETRRKRRRFAAELGEPMLRRIEGPAAVAMFATMHRKADGEKGSFMSPDMEVLFAALHERAGAVIDALVGDDGTPVAAAFGFEDPDGYYLYNNAYDPEASQVSPGVVLVSMLIENTIASGHGTFDFLKGDEMYKFRLGAEARPLYAIAGTTGT